MAAHISSTQRHRAVILTALPVEYRAVRTHLTNLKEEKHPQGTVYEHGDFIDANGRIWHVGIVEIGAGNSGAAFETERAFAHFDPHVAFFVGIAGGIKDLALRDVVAADKIYGYESGKSTNTFQARPSVGESTYSMVQRARAESKKDNWLKRIRRSGLKPPRAYIAPIAAGEKVVASVRSDVYHFLRSNYSDAVDPSILAGERSTLGGDGASPRLKLRRLLHRAHARARSGIPLRFGNFE